MPGTYAPKSTRVSLLAVFLALATSMSGQVSSQSAKPPKDFEKDEDGSFIKKRMDWFYKQRSFPGTHIPPGARLRAIQQMEARVAAEKAARARLGPGTQSSPTWQLIGPQPVNGFWGQNSGRVAALAVDPHNSNVVYSGAAQGGVWKTIDGGSNWTPLTDTQASLAVGSLALDPQNSNAIYVGTGEENNSGDSYYGAGILKSTDGGNTWTQIPGPFAGGSGGGARIGGLAVHPTNSQVVLAATGCCAPGPSGVYRSADRGNTWTNVLNVSGSQAYNVYFDPTNGSNAFASLDAHGVYRSTDGGQTWIAANGAGASSFPTSGTGRVALAMDPNSPATLYAGVTAAAGTLYGLYKTTNSGGAWTQLTNTPNYCGGQCWYDNVIGIPPGKPSQTYLKF